MDHTLGSKGLVYVFSLHAPQGQTFVCLPQLHRITCWRWRLIITPPCHLRPAHLTQRWQLILLGHLVVKCLVLGSPSPTAHQERSNLLGEQQPQSVQEAGRFRLPGPRLSYLEEFQHQRKVCWRPLGCEHCPVLPAPTLAEALPLLGPHLGPPTCLPFCYSRERTRTLGSDLYSKLYFAAFCLCDPKLPTYPHLRLSFFIWKRQKYIFPPWHC